MVPPPTASNEIQTTDTLRFTVAHTQRNRLFIPPDYLDYLDASPPPPTFSIVTDFFCFPLPNLILKLHMLHALSDFRSLPWLPPLHPPVVPLLPYPIAYIPTGGAQQKP